MGSLERGRALAVELSSCRGSVKPLSRPLSRPCLSSLVEPVEFLSSPFEADYMWRRVELLLRAVEGCRVSMSRLSSYVECAVELENGM